MVEVHLLPSMMMSEQQPRTIPYWPAVARQWCRVRIFWRGEKECRTAPVDLGGGGA